MLTRRARHEAKAEARKSDAEDEAEAQKFFSRPRPDTLENNSVCMSMNNNNNNDRLTAFDPGQPG